jgi:hypothetical protein
MQEAVRVGVNLLVALNAIGVEAHVRYCLYKDLCRFGKNRGVP